MDLEQYTKDAIRTESKIDEVKINTKMLINVLALYINAGQMLDQVKKHIFYGKDYNGDEFNNAYLTIRDAIEDIAGIPLSGNLYEEAIEVDPRVFHSIIGIATESTELCEALYHSILSKEEFDVVNLLEELGDVAWYSSILVDSTNGDWSNILETNISKLRKRFPEKFTNEDAIERNLDDERRILEGGLKNEHSA